MINSKEFFYKKKPNYFEEIAMVYSCIGIGIIDESVTV